MLTPRQTFVAFAIAAALIGGSAASRSRHQPSNDTPPQKATEPERAPSTDKRGTQEQPLSVNVVPTTEQKADARKEKASAELKAADDLELVKYTGYLVLFGIVQLGVFILQLIAFVAQAIFMRRTVTEMQSTTEAALRAAIAAEDTVGHMRDTAERQLRAYINNRMAVISNVTIGMIPDVRIEVKNWRQTPAYRVRHIANITLESFPLNIFPPTVDILQPVPPSETTIGPGSKFFIQARLAGPLVSEHIAGLNGGILAICVIGRIDYVDAFGEDRWTTYRLIYGGPRGIPPQNGMFSDTTGNDAN